MNCIDKSIEHWERILEFVKKEDIQGLKEEGWAGTSCACCEEFINQNHDEDCEGCPISAYTGEQDCIATPWWKANMALNNMIDELEAIPLVTEAVTEELDFLKKVRDVYS